MAMNPAMKAWNQHVMGVYRTMKKKNPSTRLGDAMKAAKRTWKGSATRKVSKGGRKSTRRNRRH